MKFIFCFFVLLGFANVVQSDASVDYYLTTCMENFAVAMREGIPELGMPILDPLFDPYVEIPTISDPKLKFEANGSDIFIWRQSYYIPQVHTDEALTYMNLKMNLTQFKINGSYWCDGMLGFVFPIFGEGYFTIDVMDIFIDGDGGIIITDDGYLQITQLNLTLVFDELIVYFDNFLGGGSFGDEVNEAMGELGKLFFDAIMPFIQNSILPVMLEYINTVLMQHTLAEIIGGALPGPSAVADYGQK